MSTPTHHTCGGAIQCAVDSTTLPYSYCVRCDAFIYHDVLVLGGLPQGVNRIANRQAFDDGLAYSPQA